ncbi:hypothetical protein [Erythrobacter longus]|nr:hypothetical protein [Erythrobacter longus]
MPFGLLYWSSPIITLGVATTICLYVARLVWDRSIKFQSIAWKLSFAISSIGNLLLPFLIVWLLEK